jgi:lysophospholipase L1-like esterase
MVQIAQWHAVSPVIVVQPVLGAGDKPLSSDEEQILAIRRGYGYLDLVLEIYPDMAQAALDVGQDMGILALDYTGVFDKVGETVYSDDVHLRARGNQLVAERLLSDLTPLLVEHGCTP